MKKGCKLFFGDQINLRITKLDLKKNAIQTNRVLLLPSHKIPSIEKKKKKETMNSSTFFYDGKKDD